MLIKDCCYCCAFLHVLKPRQSIKNVSIKWNYFGEEELFNADNFEPENMQYDDDEMYHIFNLKADALISFVSSLKVNMLTLIILSK